MPPFKSFILLACSFVLLSCNTDAVEDACSIPAQNRFVHDILLDRYLWYKNIDHDVDYASYDSPHQMLEFLLDRDQDRFSSIDNATEFDDLFIQGQYLGYGFSFKVNNDNSVVIQFVYDDSPAGRSALQRGDHILAINGETVQQIIDANAWNTVFGADEPGVPLDMQMRDSEGNVFDLQLEKTTVNINTVLHHSVINNGAEAVGYLLYKSFLSTSNAEFPAVFDDFRQAGIRKLILDLRYNGGGSVAVANNLASNLYAQESIPEIFARLIHNDKQQQRNSIFYLNSALNELDLDQVIVITSAATCSASEMVINGLKPFVDVKTVGSATCGKPVGMNGFRFCDNILLPVTFEIRNQDNQGEYFDGIAADCAAEDDLNFAFGDDMEPMLKEALFVSAQNRCQSLKPAAIRSATTSVAKRSDESIVRTVIGAQ